MRLFRALGTGLGGLVAVLGALAWALGALSSIAGEPPQGIDLGGDLPPERKPESAPDQSGEGRARSRIRLPRPHLPRIAGFGGLVAWARRRRRLATVLAVTAVFLVGVGLYAFFFAGATPGTGAQAKAGTLVQGNTPSPSATSLVAGTNSTTLSWTQASVNGTKFGQAAGGGYLVTRYAVNAPSTPLTPDGTCNVLITGNPNTLSCADNNVPTGRWQYTIMNALYNWRSTQSPKSSVVTVAPAPPVSVTFVNGGGTGSAFINNANKSSLSFDVVLPSTSLSTNTVTLTLTDPGAAHTVTATLSGTSGAGTLHFTGVNGSSLNDGLITIAAKATSSYGDDSGSTSITKTKDTVAPDAPTSIVLSNGLGQGGAYLNNTNKASVSFNVGWAASANNTSTDTINLTITSGASASGSASRGASSPTAVTGINATALTDGTVSASATATDLAGNTSTTLTNSTAATKDVVAPDAPTSIALTNGGGAGSIYINSANKASVNFNVGWSASANNTSTDTISVTITKGASASGSAARGGSSPTAVTGINGTPLTDGTNISASATATDLAGNTSTAFTNSNVATKDTVAPDAPTAVAINNGLGQGNAYINNTNKASVDYLVTIPSGANNSTTDTVKVTLTSGASVSGTKTPSNPGGTVTVSGIDTTTLTDGTVNVSAIATDLAGNDSTAKTGTTPKDVVAPDAPTAVAISNGLGQGNAYINNTNKASVNYDVTTPAGASNSTTDTITVSLTSGVTVSGTKTPAPGSGGGTVTVTGINVSTLTEGTVNVSATSTDLAGNVSTAKTGTTTKDTVAPSQPTSVTIANGGGTANAINNANKGSVNYSVVMPSGAANSTTDTIKVTLTSGGTVSGTTTPAPGSAGGTATVTGINATSLTDGTVSVSAISTDLAGNDSTARAGSTPKDVVAPTVSSVSLTNGGGAGSAYINNTNKTSLNFGVVLGANSVASDSVSFAANDAGNLHSVSAGPAAGIAGGGTRNFTGVNATSLNDGTITLTATSTDTAGNVGTATSSVTKDVVAPAAPTAVAINNGLGQGNAYINNTNKASVDYLVTIPSGANNSTTDTVKVTLTSGASVSGTKTPSNPGGTVTVSGIDTTTLTDGTVNVSAIATDLAGNDSTAKTGTTTKDTVAPNVTGVSLTNGGGTGNAFINNANKGSVNFSVALGSNSLATDTVTFNVHDAGSAHSTTPATQPGTAGAGSDSFNALNLTAFNDGTITLTGTSTDLAGNVGTATATVTKDTVAPTLTITSCTTNGSHKPSCSGTSTDTGTVTVTIYNGSNGSGSVAQTLTGSGTSWSVGPGGALTGGASYSAQATQTDAAGNTGTSAFFNFTA